MGGTLLHAMVGSTLSNSYCKPIEQRKGRKKSKAKDRHPCLGQLLMGAIQIKHMENCRTVVQRL